MKTRPFGVDWELQVFDLGRPECPASRHSLQMAVLVEEVREWLNFHRRSLKRIYIVQAAGTLVYEGGGTASTQGKKAMGKTTFQLTCFPTITTYLLEMSSSHPRKAPSNLDGAAKGYLLPTS